MNLKSGALIFLLGIAAPIPFWAGNLLAQSQDSVVIGVVQDGPGRYSAFRQTIQDEVIDLTGKEFNVRFPPEKLIVADWTISGIDRAVTQLLEDPDVDIVITSGVLSSNNISRRRNLSKPVIAPYVINPAIQGIPVVKGRSGVNNLSFVTYPHDFRRDFKTFKEVFDFTNLVIFADRLNMQTIPDLPDTVGRIAEETGIHLELVTVDTLAAPALARIPDDAEAVYLVPLLRMPEAEFDSLIQGINRLGLPSFSLLGRSDVERGVLASLAPDTDPARLSRRVAVNVQRILLGENASELPVTLNLAESPTVNLATARQIGIFPSWTFLTGAEVLNAERKSVDRELTLWGSVQEAVARNLDLAAAAREVAVRGQDVRGARSILLPQVNLATDASVIDEDRAAAGFGLNPQREWTGTASLDQLILSEPAWANLSISGHFEDAAIENREQVRLDISFDAAATYLSVLRAKTIEGIQQDNLGLSRSNLALAVIRVDVGFASPAEVYRWESRIATSRQAVIDAVASRNVAEITLNRILNYGLEDPFDTEETGLQDSSLITSDPRFLNYFSDQGTFRKFRTFMVEEAFEQSPELKEIRALIAAQDRILSSSKRKWWVPEIGLRGDITGLFAEGGTGTKQEAEDTRPPELGPLPDDVDWFVGLRATYPLFTGLGRPAEVSAAGEELARLRIQDAALRNFVEDRVRTSLHLSGASFAGIRLSRDAAEASDKNLELVTDSYSRGVVSIIDLLDAQNSALVSNLDAANSIFDFMVDLMSVERATGQFYFFKSAEEREDWFQKAQAYFDGNSGTDNGQ